MFFFFTILVLGSWCSCLKAGNIFLRQVSESLTLRGDEISHGSAENLEGDVVALLLLLERERSASCRDGSLCEVSLMVD